MPINQLFPLSSSGVITARDALVMDLSLSALRQRISYFRDPKVSDADVKTRLNLSENYAWKVSEAREQLMEVEDCEPFYTDIAYRPFNFRKIFFHASVAWRMRMKVMSQMQRENLALITTRQTRDEFGALASQCIAGHKSVSTYDISSVFPLYLYPEAGRSTELFTSRERVPNVSDRFLNELASALDIQQEGAHGLPSGVTPENIFHYTYAVLHSPGYRRRYAESLKIEFPRILFPGGLSLFMELSRLGDQLVALHVMVSPNLENLSPMVAGSGDFEVEKVSYSDETVWIDKAQTRGFKGVPEEVWNFHIGGYQVCEKWLKDRQAKGGKNPRPGRVLTDEDIEHYQKIVVALSETIRIMAEIDEVIEAHGGWPGAFVTEAEELPKVAEDAADYDA